MTEVKLHVYDLTRGLAAAMSVQFLGKYLEGIWHTGIVVYDKEYWFGAGIFSAPPGQSHHGHPQKIISLGYTEITYSVFEEYLSEISSQFQPQNYNLFTHNCNTFTDTVSMFLTGKSIPNYIRDLPQEVLSSPLGPLIKPLFDSWQQTSQNPLPWNQNNSSSNTRFNSPTQTIVSPTITTKKFNVLSWNQCEKFDTLPQNQLQKLFTRWETNRTKLIQKKVEGHQNESIGKEEIFELNTLLSSIISQGKLTDQYIVPEIYLEYLDTFLKTTQQGINEKQSESNNNNDEDLIFPAIDLLRVLFLNQKIIDRYLIPQNFETLTSLIRKYVPSKTNTSDSDLTLKTTFNNSRLLTLRAIANLLSSNKNTRQFILLLTHQHPLHKDSQVQLPKVNSEESNSDPKYESPMTISEFLDRVNFALCVSDTSVNLAAGVILYNISLCLESEREERHKISSDQHITDKQVQQEEDLAIEILAILCQPSFLSNQSQENHKFVFTLLMSLGKLIKPLSNSKGNRGDTKNENENEVGRELVLALGFKIDPFLKSDIPKIRQVAQDISIILNE